MGVSSSWDGAKCQQSARCQGQDTRVQLQPAASTGRADHACALVQQKAFSRAAKAVNRATVPCMLPVITAPADCSGLPLHSRSTAATPAIPGRNVVRRGYAWLIAHGMSSMREKRRSQAFLVRLR
eukprot:TRINITY_DN83110_c0_g1_i1.p4 TRINITY_DN83110_c0_g1~~TRINITY_DN83110_c0_g1_i1.p4  ORF type:complete len:125 (-),score=10.39 TRINITY_DN83110_c0_g1_i1:29-403(-)